MRIDLLAKWLKEFPYGYCNGINFQTCRTNKNIDCPYCVSDVHCSDGNAAIDYYREMLRYMRLKPRQARKRTLMFAETLPNIMRLLDVVRCKDCKHYNTVDCSKGFGWCENIDRGTSDNFYCANGKQLNKESDEAWNLPAETKDNSIILNELIPRCTPKAAELLKSRLLGAIKVCAVNEWVHVRKK